MERTDGKKTVSDASESEVPGGREMMQMHQGDLSLPYEYLIEGFVADALDLAELSFARQKRAVGILWRGSVRNRQETIAERERVRASKRGKGS